MLTIGWKEYISFPEWNLKPIRVKVDTGAKTSALDVARYELIYTDCGPRAVLHLALGRDRKEAVVVSNVPWLGMVRVRSTSGRLERRPVVEALVRLGSVTKMMQVTLTNRQRMRYRMILGRRALEGDFVVDVSKKYLLRK